MKKARITMSLDPALWKKVQQIAKKHNMSGSRMVGIMMQAGLVRLNNKECELFDLLSERKRLLKRL